MGVTNSIQLRRDSLRNVSPIVRVTRFTQEQYDYGAHDVRLTYKEWRLIGKFSLGSRLYPQYIRKKRRQRAVFEEIIVPTSDDPDLGASLPRKREQAINVAQQTTQVRVPTAG
jgi:hypothetical protein